MSTNDATNLIVDMGIGDEFKRITAKECYLKDFTINTNVDVEPAFSSRGMQFARAPPPIEIDMSFIMAPTDLNNNPLLGMLYGKYVPPTIKNKRVKDCTVNELLFAARQKILHSK